MNKITTAQLLDGVIRYVDKEVIPNVDDVFTKLAIRTLAINAATNSTVHDTFNKLMNSTPATFFIQPDADGLFDIESLIDALRQAINEYGELVVKIPPIRFVSPEEKILRFKASDISTLKQYITTVTTE